jgi:putative ABC transport system permease protein
MNEIKKIHPPRFCEKLLCRFLHESERRALMGDYEELFLDLANKRGRGIAVLWFWMQILIALLSSISHKILWGFIMAWNYLKIALRNLRKYKGHTFINIASLFIGLTCCLLIFLYIRYELSYDKHHEYADDIYRINSEISIERRGSYINATSPGLLAPALLSDIPEVANAARIVNDEKLITIGTQCFCEKKFFYADPEILDIFTFPLLNGDAASALNAPNTVLLTEKKAQKYFGKENPLGKILIVDNKDFIITGILKDIPQNSHFTFDFLASMRTVGQNMFRWNSTNFLRTYIRLKKGTDPEPVEAKLPALLEKYMEDPFWTFHFQPVTGIHLQGNISHEWEVNSHIGYIYIFTATACIILLIACFNYINLSTARASIRMKEIGVRKVAGAGRNQLIRQFMGETLILAFAALLLAVLCAKIIMPWFSLLVHRELVFKPLTEMKTILGMAVLMMLIGILSGLYPALYLSRIQPVESLKGRKSSRNVTPLRHILVVGQFVISIALIFSTFVVHRQLAFVKHGDLGFAKDNILHVDITAPDLQNAYEPLVHALKQHPNITGLAFSSHLPNDVTSHTGGMRWEGFTGEEMSSFYEAFIDASFLDVYGIQIVQGRNFSQSIPSDLDQAYIINETAAKLIGWENPIGRRFGYGSNGVVIGVVKDFHHQSYHQRIQPVVFMFLGPDRSYRRERLSIQVKSENISETLAFIKDQVEAFGQPFQYAFFDDDIAKMYDAESQMELVFKVFACLSIIIASLGLFGLATYMAEQRRKEIGIRKVTGASEIRIVAILSKGFVRWVIVASLLAWPFAYFLMNQWLQTFIYRTSLNVWMFILSGLAALVIALLTISFQTIKAARANPIDSLRYE